MARYINEFRGISAHDEPSRGLDPNYRDGHYFGMRSRGRPTQASYGTYRQLHRNEFWGVEEETEPYRLFRSTGREEKRQRGGRDGREWQGRDWQGGGVHDLRREPEFLHDFNSYSPAFRSTGREERSRSNSPYDRHFRPEPREGMPLHQGRLRPGYGNRGLSSSGYAEPWGRGEGER